MTRKLFVLGVLAGLAVAGGVFVYNRFFREQPAPYFASDEEHFLYGSIGTESEQGVPYWIWLVLPPSFRSICPAREGTPLWDFWDRTATNCPSVCRG